MPVINNSNFTTTVTIANGQTVSATLDTQGGFLGGIMLPAALTSTTLTFNVSVDNNTFVALKDTSGSAISYTVGTSRAISFSKDVFAAWPYVQLVGGSSEGAARTITCVVRAA